MGVQRCCLHAEVEDDWMNVFSKLNTITTLGKVTFVQNTVWQKLMLVIQHVQGNHEQ